MDITEIVLKLLLAVALGGLIGLERESSHKPAGFRTNILICIGSTMAMILSGLLLEGQEGSGDFTRIAAAVITGMGFIGAGSIIQARGNGYGADDCGHTVGCCRFRPWLSEPVFISLHLSVQP